MVQNIGLDERKDEMRRCEDEYSSIENEWIQFRRLDLMVLQKQYLILDQMIKEIGKSDGEDEKKEYMRLKGECNNENYI